MFSIFNINKAKEVKEIANNFNKKRKEEIEKIEILSDNLKLKADNYNKRKEEGEIFYEEHKEKIFKKINEESLYGHYSASFFYMIMTENDFNYLENKIRSLGYDFTTYIQYFNGMDIGRAFNIIWK